jgi:hypothetical protein
MNTQTGSITITPVPHGKTGLLDHGVTREGLVAVESDLVTAACGKQSALSSNRMTSRHNGGDCVSTRSEEADNGR